MGKVKITETSLRDGHQSLMATRMTTAEMLPIIETMDKVGYYAMEVWGGATYDAAIRFLHEDPWERVREIRKRAKNTKLQMLLRGQNLLGYRHYADDIVDRFVELSIKNGIDIIRTFDALNDTRNIRQASESTKKYGGFYGKGKNNGNIVKGRTSVTYGDKNDYCRNASNNRNYG